MSKNQIIVAPSILAADFGKLATEIQSVDQGGADWLHLDIMDGTFVPPITFGDNMVALAKRSTKLFLDVHLMIARPDAHVKAFADAGASQITIHCEICPHLYRNLSSIRELGKKSGVALNPATPVEHVFDALDAADLVLIMTVNPGWGGQPFIEHCVDKIAALKKEIDRRGLKTIIEVDGGINSETAKRCVAAGATALVAGSYVFNSADRKQAIAQLRG